MIGLDIDAAGFSFDVFDFIENLTICIHDLYNPDLGFGFYP